MRKQNPHTDGSRLPFGGTSNYRAYPGERHAPLINQSTGQIQIAQFAGPATQIEKRVLVDKTNPISLTDMVSMEHDLNYGLARNYKGVRKADDVMVDALERAKKKSLDLPTNIATGLYPIKAKIKAEDWGLVKPGYFASYGGIKKKNKKKLKKVKKKVGDILDSIIND